VLQQFEKSVAAAQARDKVTNLFGQHVSPVVVEQLLDANVQSERRTVCVLFLDIRGFTAMTRTRSADETVSLLNDFFAEMIAVVDRHHGIINKFLGFVRGFRLKRGALAATNNCENQNLVIVGCTDAAIAAAVKALADFLPGGGQLAVDENGEMLGTGVSLDVAGCMSSASWEMVTESSRQLDTLVKDSLGGVMKNPFLIASFIGLVAVPDLGLTELGLVVDGGEELIDPVLQIIPGVVAADAMKVCCRCPSHIHDVHELMSSKHPNAVDGETHMQ